MIALRQQDRGVAEIEIDIAGDQVGNRRGLAARRHHNDLGAAGEPVNSCSGACGELRVVVPAAAKLSLPGLAFA